MGGKITDEKEMQYFISVDCASERVWKCIG